MIAIFRIFCMVCLIEAAKVRILFGSKVIAL